MLAHLSYLWWEIHWQNHLPWGAGFNGDTVSSINSTLTNKVFIHSDSQAPSAGPWINGRGNWRDVTDYTDHRLDPVQGGMKDE